MGYASRNNPTAVAAKNGELPPKKRKMSKREQDAWLMEKIAQITGASASKNQLKGM